MWQYTSKGEVDGISGNVDMERLTDEGSVLRIQSVRAPVASRALGIDKHRVVQIVFFHHLQHC